MTRKMMQWYGIGHSLSTNFRNHTVICLFLYTKFGHVIGQRSNLWEMIGSKYRFQVFTKSSRRETLIIAFRDKIIPDPASILKRIGQTRAISGWIPRLDHRKNGRASWKIGNRSNHFLFVIDENDVHQSKFSGALILNSALTERPDSVAMYQTKIKLVVYLTVEKVTLLPEKLLEFNNFF